MRESSESAVPRVERPEGTPLPCPFCGVVPDVTDLTENEWLIACASDDCDKRIVEAIAKSESGAIAEWNTRASLAFTFTDSREAFRYPPRDPNAPAPTGAPIVDLSSGLPSGERAAGPTTEELRRASLPTREELESEGDDWREDAEPAAARLAAIRARCENATLAPWSVVERERGSSDIAYAVESAAFSDEEPGVCGDYSRKWPLDKGDADFIAAAPEDVPWLLAEVERLTAALSQRPRAETPTGDTFDVSRMRTYLAAGNHVDAMAEYAALLGMCFEQHTKLRAAADRHNLALGDAHVADVVIAALDRLSTAPRVPEAGSAPLPNEDSALLDALDAMREFVVRPTMPEGEPELIAHAWGVYGQCETVREALRAHVLRDSQPSASTTGEAANLARKSWKELRGVRQSLGIRVADAAIAINLSQSSLRVYEASRYGDPSARARARYVAFLTDARTNARAADAPQPSAATTGEADRE